MISRHSLILLLLVVACSAAAAPATKPAQRIACLGDSITDGFTYPLLVQQALREAKQPVPLMINAGYGGDGVAAMRQRLDRDVFAYHPDLVIVSAGINDLGLPDGKYEAGLNALLDDLAKQKVGVLVLTLSTLSPRHKQIFPRCEAYNEILRKAASAHNMKVGEVALSMGKAMAAGEVLNEPDGSHLSFAGYRAFVRGVLDGLGHPDVVVPEHAKLTAPGGLVHDWKILRQSDDKPLTAEAVAALKIDDSWKPLTLPSTEAQASWFWEQEQQLGMALNLDKLAGDGNRFVGVATFKADADRDVVINVGCDLHTIWLNGERIYQSGSGAAFHIGRDHIPAQLKAGSNSIVIESGKMFHLTIDDIATW